LSGTEGGEVVVALKAGSSAASGICFGFEFGMGVGFSMMCAVTQRKKGKVERRGLKFWFGRVY
jgi:hypothetical protein